MSTPPRRLYVLPCAESYADMAADPDGGRCCERCACRVHDASELERAQLDDLLERARTERVCLRSTLVEGRPRLAAGVAAGLVIAALAGCATGAAIEPEVDAVMAAQVEWGEGEAGMIAGVVADRERGEPIEDAIVVLQSTSLPGQREAMTNARGLYHFGDLPPGEYVIQVLAGKANVSKITRLPEGARFRANFAVSPDEGNDVLMGAVVEKPAVPLDASSTYHSSLVWIPG